MLRSVASKAMWVGRTTAAVIGLAIALALVIGVATMALAAVPGDPFKLGQINTINALTQLVGSRGGPMLTIDNNSTNDTAHALNLQVDGGNPPIRVNANSGTATGLSADRLDGLDSSGLVQGRVSISGTPSQSFGAIVEHFEGFGNYGVGLRKVVSHPEQGNPIDISISCTNQNTLGALRIENKGEFGDSQFVWVDDGSTNPSFTTLLADNFTDRPVPTGSEHLTIRITNVFSPTRMATIELFTRHGNTGCDANAHALYTFAP